MDTHVAELGALRPGDHVCFPYEHEHEKWATLVSFVRDGLARQERCLYIGTAADQVALLEALDAAGLPAQRELERGALVLATQGETYLRTGRLDTDDMLELIDGLIERALVDGFQGLRGTGEASKVLPEELWPEALRYESQINARFARRPFTALCRYRADLVTPSRAQDLLRAHPVALVRGAVCENPFYERPEVDGDTRARLDWQMHQVRAYNRSRQRLKAAVESRRRSFAPGAGVGAGAGAGDLPESDLAALVREAAQRHVAYPVAVDAPHGVPGRWDRRLVEQLVEALLAAANRPAGATISVRDEGDRARLTFGEPGASSYTVELPRVPTHVD